MTSFFFGTGARPLFGAYHPPGVQSGGASYEATALLLVPAWGNEYLRAHRSYRQLAISLAAAGAHALRFDYYGTGDSGGESTDMTMSSLLGDVILAIEELKDTAQMSRVGLVGLRLGALLAARVAEERDDVDALLLWDPVDAREYAAELPEDSELPLNAAMRAELAGLELPVRWPVRTLALHSRPGQRALAGVAAETIATPPAWLEHAGLGAGAIPHALLARIVRWAVP